MTTDERMADNERCISISDNDSSYSIRTESVSNNSEDLCKLGMHIDDENKETKTNSDDEDGTPVIVTDTSYTE